MSLNTRTNIQTQVCEFIVYACPTGELAQQLATYFDRARAECGPNTAHRYMPHITLTGFFHDEPTAIRLYVEALGQAHAAWVQSRAAGNGKGSTHDGIQIAAMRFQDEFHFLQIESPCLQQITAHFANLADSPTRRDALRLKDWLHLSLAYEFRPEHRARLVQLATQLVDISAPVAWELRFYERRASDEWLQHAAWLLT